MTTPTTSTLTAPDLTPGTWAIDPAHSEIAFTVRHLMSKVRGVFREFDGELVIADDVLASTARTTIELTSVDTGSPQRDQHLRSGDFFGVEAQPTMTFVSTSLRPVGDGYHLTGALTLNGQTREVELALEQLGVQVDAYARTVAGFEATGQISRKEFGVNGNVPLDGDRFLIGDTVAITLTIQAVRQA